ncbi:MAG: sulfite exporter TauE/SafE family protein [Planctomycetia bacterium]|nr:sulfite exporter TauE/SafE family protein [Planctomycetia bacterium]
MEFIISGLMLGFLTSFHCIGMCGPIAIAIPLHGEYKFQRLFGGILYNLGRTTTYIIFGFIFGLLGQSLGALGFQRWVSIIAGALMIITVLSPSLFNPNFNTTGIFNSLFSRVKIALKRLFSIRSFGGLYLIGLLNGLLPCGPLYMAFIISTGTGNAISASIFMLMFGLGTIPLLFSITVLGNSISIPVRNRIKNLFPILILIIGLLFILRGLNLGIPYLSPKEEMIKMKYKKTLEEQKMNNSLEHNIES